MLNLRRKVKNPSYLNIENWKLNKSHEEGFFHHFLHSNRCNPPKKKKNAQFWLGVSLLILNFASGTVLPRLLHHGKTLHKLPLYA